MPKADVKVDAPDGTLTVFDTGLSTSTMYDTNKHPLIQGGDFQNPHLHYDRMNTPTTRLKNGR